MTMELNELNKNARGGTELMEQRIRKYVDFDGIQLICSRVRELDKDKKKILWVHDLSEDPEVAHLKNGGWLKFDKIVFVSHWQQAMYNKVLGVPYNMGIVIPNCIEDMGTHEKPDPEEKVRMIYFSTPHRGLNITYSVFNELYKSYGDSIELNVFSSFDLYGWGERDEQFKEIFKLCEDHPGINYSKSVSNDEIREELKRTHILAYPSTWQETSCLVLIESMASGLYCVHSSLGALPETSMGLTAMYQYGEDMNAHASNFYMNLDRGIQNILNSDTLSKELLQLTSTLAATKYDVKNIIPRWESLVNQIRGT